MVLIAQRWILARLRKRTFFELAELNAAIRRAARAAQQPADAEARRRAAASCWSGWIGLRSSRCRPRATSSAQWKKCKVNIDYHVEVDHHLYSVPYQLVGAEARGALHRHDRRDLLQGPPPGVVPAALRPPATRREPEHMPSSHRAHAEWTPSRLIHWAEKTGPACGRCVAGILKSRPHPEQGYRACLGLMRLGQALRRLGRLEAACERAEHLRSYSYRTVKNILAASQDRLPFEEEASDARRHAHPRQHPRRRVLRRRGKEDEC